ncbi:MAG: hypothetical protein JSR99_16150 [Proteobacteria bacterium]|nr:hypothetical protein [Pseudomonadota bacterium]
MYLLLFPIVGLGIPATATIAFADSVPESIRIQQQAEKAYEAAPVVPIERGNAHHRDLQKDEEGGDELLLPMQRSVPPAPKDKGGTQQ